MTDKQKECIILADQLYGNACGPESQVVIHVRSGRIVSLMPIHEFNFPKGQHIHLRAKRLAPLFCDYHIHLRSGRQELQEKIAGPLLRHGIGHAYDGGSPDGRGVTLRKTLGRFIRLKTPGTALVKEGGYGLLIGAAVSGLRPARRMIDRLADAGADYLKVVHSGIYDPETDAITRGGFTSDELRQLVAHARRRGLPVFCHVNGQKRISEAVDSGVSCIIHGLGVSVATLKRMSVGGTAFIPTVHAFESLTAITRTAAARMNLEKRLRKHLFALGRAFDLGVPVLPGSDSGSSLLPYGVAYLRELACFRSAGIPDHSVIHAAIARHLQAGMSADFQVLDGLRPGRVFMRGLLL